MKTENENIEELDWEKIASYISEDMPVQEAEAFEMLIDKNEDYQQAISEAKQMKDPNTPRQSDSEEAWQKVSAKIKTWENNKTKVSALPKRPAKIFYRVAAVFFALITLSFAAYYAKEKSLTKERIFASSINEQNKSITLSDGTQVQLNAGATLYYSNKLGEKERKVRFEGEAFFDVAKNAERPFIIGTKNANVAVLGTSFNLLSKGNKTEVMVSSGLVQLSKLNDNSENILLQKGEIGILENKIAVKKKIEDFNYLSWKTQQMVFDQTPLSKVLMVIEKTYNVEISQQEQIDNTLLLTSTFDHEPLNIILESIGKTFNLTYEINGREIIFSTK